MDVDSTVELEIQPLQPSEEQCAPSPAPVGCCRCSLAPSICAVARGMFSMIPVLGLVHGPSSASRLLHNCFLCSGNSCQKEHKQSLAPCLISISSHTTKNLIRVWDQYDRITCVVQAAFLRAHLRPPVSCPALGAASLAALGRGLIPRALCGTCEGLLFPVELPIEKSPVLSPL